MKCLQCGKDNAANETFCDDCGAKLTPGGQPPPPPPVQQGIGKKCPHCPGTHPADLPFCPETGLPLTPETETPPGVCSCGHPITAGAKFCLNCGAKVQAADIGPGAATAKAALIFPDGVRKEITGSEFAIERKGFIGIVSADDAKCISRERHAVISQAGGKYYIEDEKSANGTTLNGGADIKGKGKQELKDNDVIDVAEVIKLTFKLA